MSLNDGKCTFLETSKIGLISSGNKVFRKSRFVKVYLFHLLGFGIMNIVTMTTKFI